MSVRDRGDYAEAVAGNNRVVGTWYLASFPIERIRELRDWYYPGTRLRIHHFEEKVTWDE